MKYSIRRDTHSGRFRTVKITGEGKVVTTLSETEVAVPELTLARARRAANTSLERLGGK